MENKKRILIASWTYYPAWSYGGIARVMYDLSKSLSMDWYSVDAITTDVFDNNSRNKKEQDTSEGIQIFYFKNRSNTIANKLKTPLPIGLSKWLETNIRKYDIVHIGDFRNLFNYEVFLYCKKYNIPYIISPFWTVPYKKDLRWIIKWIYDKTWSQDFLRNAKYITVQTENEKKELIAYGINPSIIKLIPLMIEYEKFKGLPEKGIIRKKYNISTDAKILLFVGRIHEYKATNMMIDCFHKYQKTISNSYLIIIGRDDGYEKHLKDKVNTLEIREKVLFVWAIYYPENKNYYRDADIYFMAPSHYEETSTASLEALACWTPVVVTEQADIPFIEKYNAGKVVKYEKKAILDALLSVEKNETSSADCIRLIEEHFDIKSIKNEFIKLYF